MSIRRSIAEIMAGVDHQPGSARKIDNNTVQYFLEDGTMAVRLHLTTIAQLEPGGLVRLTSGGYRTNITRDRMNHVLFEWYRIYRAGGYSSLRGGYAVWRDKKQWMIGNNVGKVKLFVDGIVIEPTGWLRYPGDERKMDMGAAQVLHDLLLEREVPGVPTRRLMAGLPCKSSFIYPLSHVDVRDPLIKRLCRQAGMGRERLHAMILRRSRG